MLAVQNGLHPSLWLPRSESRSRALDLEWQSLSIRTLDNFLDQDALGG